MNKRQNWWLSQTGTTRQTLFVLVTVALFSALTGALLSNQWEDLIMHFGLEMAGAVAAFVLVDQVLNRSDERKLLNCEMIPRLRSRVNTVALATIEDLGHLGWLYDESLRGAYLSGANWQGAKLRDADLQEALLAAANLQGADLFRANLQGPHFWRANLREVNLTAANLQDAILQEANLTGAIFSDATVLPDGTTWTPATDMSRFTDSRHPDAWRRDYNPTVMVEISPPWTTKDE